MAVIVNVFNYFCADLNLIMLSFQDPSIAFCASYGAPCFGVCVLYISY